MNFTWADNSKQTISTTYLFVGLGKDVGEDLDNVAVEEIGEGLPVVLANRVNQVHVCQQELRLGLNVRLCLL